MPSWPALRGKVIAFRRREGVPCSSRSSKSEILVKSWSLTSLQHRLMKTGGRLVKHARHYWLLLAEGYLNRRLFGDMLRRIWALPVPGG